MIGALLDDKAAGDDLLAEVISQPVHRAISVPSDVIEEFQGVSARGEIEQLRLSFQPLATGWLLQWYSGQAVGRGGRQ